MAAVTITETGKSQKAVRLSTACLLLLQNESRSKAARVAIVITDGRSNHPILTTQEALKAKSAGIVMLTVGVGHAISKVELSQIATSEREMFDVSDFSGLQGVIGILRKLLCKSKCEYRLFF